ncbi:hypothetical protein [Moritella sp. F3]|uniref:hypothetical protein n=1 Tax=Moritella sp. F3 TaxID=2718882 RepID=UPI0018E1B736|nr:hypothetical protein [Moritella sp. F3]GIC77064.1 hypothetical protein FMO001_17910 [Moritella sp. F1]GIC82183.1 hypothetical protein FMO003_24640 [Moritella sp. F3]
MDSFATKITNSKVYELLEQNASDNSVSNLYKQYLQSGHNLSRTSFYLYAQTYKIRDVIDNNPQITKSQVLFLLKKYAEYEPYTDRPFESIDLFIGNEFNELVINKQLKVKFNSNKLLLGTYFVLTEDDIYPVRIHQDKSSFASNLLFLSWWSIWLSDQPIYADIPTEVRFLFKNSIDGDKSSFMFSLLKVLRKDNVLQPIHRSIAMQSTEELLMRYSTDPCCTILIYLLANN